MILLNLIIPHNNMIEYKFSNITLKIKGSGNQKVLSKDFNSSYYPDIIYINGNRETEIKYQYNFGTIDKINTVNLIWNNSIDNCYSMFSRCPNIIEIDLSNFDSSQVTEISLMFQYCYLLSSINFTNFDSSKVTGMGGLFLSCGQLSMFDISKFNTSQVKDMGYMFSGLKLISSLDLSHFDTSKVTNMIYMFNDCLNLGYINLKNFIEHDPLRVINIFLNVPDNIVVCLNGNSIKILEQMQSKNGYILNCEIKPVFRTDICFDYSNNGILYKYEYEGKYHEKLTDENLISNSPIKYCKCANENEKCLYCSNKNLINNNICIECNHINDYYEKEKENDNNSNENKECYKEPIGYYFHVSDSLYKKCYNSCKTCKIQGDNFTHNCLEFNIDYPMKFKINNNYFNCFQNCS